MKKFIGVLVIIWTMVFATACPVSPASLQKAKESSGKIATYANTGVELTRQLFRSNFLTLAQKDLIAEKFVTLARAGVLFDQTVTNALQQYGTNAPPASEIQKISAIFDAQIVQGFLAILASLKVISSNGSFGATIELIRSAVLVIAGIFGSQKQVSRKIAATA